MSARLAGRLLLVGFLAWYGFVSFRSPEAYRLLDSVDLAIHETGHLVFAPFGEWMGVFGGTLFQLLVPAAFVAHFAWRRELFAASACLWWVAQSLWNTSVYIADARAQVLPLVGGGEHDWEYLLGAAGLLARDQEVARLVHGVGVLLYATAIAGALITVASPAAGAAPGGDAARAPADAARAPADESRPEAAI